MMTEQARTSSESFRLSDKECVRRVLGSQRGAGYLIMVFALQDQVTDENAGSTFYSLTESKCKSNSWSI